MEDNRQAKLVSLFERGVRLPAAERTAFLDQVCAGDDALRQELGSLLHASDSASGYFDALAEQVIAPAYTAIADGGGARDLLPELRAALGETYSIERELTGGAMSRVFLAEDLKLGRKVVIKMLPPEMAASVSAERFRREIQVAAQLQHPHIVPLLTSDSAASFLYYTMPYVAGESLHERLASEEPLGVDDAVGIWRDVLDALAHAHANGVVHRDIKPSNILLSGRNALVTDFGIARAIEAAAGDALLTATGLIIGTPTYMAPEQVTGSADADHRVDIYAAALVMYEMLEGHPPFSANSVRELVLARLGSPPRPLTNPGCPPGIADLVLQCLATDPAERPQSAEAVIAALGPATTQTHSAAFAPPRSFKRMSYIAAAVVVAAAAFGATQMRRNAAGTAATGQMAPPSLAVLPLASLSTDPADSALTDGMTEEITATLSRIGNLRVIARTSVMALKDRGLDVRQIAESLRVSHVLEGGLQRVGPRLRLQVRLVDARDNSTAWSARYDRDMGDIFAVQEDISRAIASELDVRLVGAAHRGSLRRRNTPSIAAYELYLRGMDKTLIRDRAGLKEALNYFKRAIAEDTSFAAAHAALAGIYLFHMAGEAPGDHRQWYARAEQAGLKAVALDDSLAEAHVALGWARLTLRDWASAEAEFKKAVALDPRIPRAYEGLAAVYLLVGRPVKQLAAARQAIGLDPFSDGAVRAMAHALNGSDRCEESLRLLRPFKALDRPFGPAGIIGGLCHARKRRWPEAIAEFRWTTENTDARAALAFLGYALARAGNEDEARTILADLLAGRKNSHGAFGIAVVYAGFRDYDRAFAWLDKAMDENSIRVYLMDPAFADLHADPRFDRLKARMGIQKR